MNWFLVLFPLSLLITNILLYKSHHKRIAAGFENSDCSRRQYEVSLPTRLFSKIKYLIYLASLVHVVANPLLLNPDTPGIGGLVIGVALGVGAIGLLHASLASLGHNYAPCYTGDLPQSLVTSGPYRYCSHPIYLSNLLLFSSFAILSFGWIIVAVLSVLLYVYYFTIRDENRALRTRFPRVE